MFRATLLLCLLSTPALAQEDAFIDDRSSAEAVVRSLYNAIDRKEYLRGWSYFAEDAAPPYEEFRDGYGDTESVDLRLGETASEGAAGSVHFSVPVAILATASDGTETVFTGCYRLTQVQPAVQETPPYRPIRIDRGELAESDAPFVEAMGSCD